MTILQDHQFEILPSMEASNGFVFGIGARVSVNGDGFDPGENEWLTQDTQNTRRGVQAFGRDVLTAKTWSWASHVDGVEVEDAVATLEDFSAAWAPDLLVRDPGAMTSLRYALAGRTRRVFGRPRRYAAPPTNLILSGYVPIDHDFQCVDAFTYDDVESQFFAPYTSAVSGGGFAFETTFPIATTPSEGSGQGQISIGGNARTYPVIRFIGPWTNPKITTDEWSLQWTGSVPNGGWIEIDCRPWMLTVKDQSGASRVSGLDRRTWLEDCWFAPKSQPEFYLSGLNASGSAACLVKWRNAWTSL